MTKQPASSPGEVSGFISEAISVDEFHLHRLHEVLFEGEIQGQFIRIAQTANGRAFIRNGRLQSLEGDEWAYHEGLVHPALVHHEAPRRVLCIGGSTGGILREILKYESVERATFVEANHELIALTRRFLPHLDCGVFDDPRTEIVEESANSWLERTGAKFDAIIADPPEPNEHSPIPVDYQDAGWIANASAWLNPGGIMTVAAGAANGQADSPLPSAVVLAHRSFPNVDVSIIDVPSLGTTWGFISCSLSGRVSLRQRDEVDSRLSARGVTALRYYDGITHERIFLMPAHLRAWLAGAKRNEHQT